MFGMQRLLLSIVIAAGSVSFGNATTVKPMHEWSYEKEADYHILRYLHEAWDSESIGFTIECHPTDKKALTIGYSVIDDNYFKAYKRKQLKPKLAIQSRQGRLNTLVSWMRIAYRPNLYLQSPNPYLSNSSKFYPARTP
jgi:hypothetical protein